MRRRFSPVVALASVITATLTVHAQPQWQDVVRNLRHPNAATRLEAVQRLGSAGYVQAIDPITPLILDPEDQVQGAALDAELTFFVTEKLGSGSRILGVGSSKSRAQQAFEAGPLIRTATVAPQLLVDNLIAAIRDPNPRVSFDAVHAVGFIAEGPLTPTQAAALADNLDHYDPIIRAATARVIGRLQVHEAADQLRGAIEDSNGTVRFYAIESLGKLRERRALPALLDIIQRGKQPVYIQQAYLALGRIAAPDDLATFRERIVDKDPVVRRASLEALGRLKDQDSHAAIEQAFNTDKSQEVRLAAAFALHQLGTVQSHTIAANLVVEAVSAQARDYLFELGHDAIPGVESALKVATNPEHRANLAQLVGYLGTQDDLPIVEPLLKDKDQRVVRAASNAILRLRR